MSKLCSTLSQRNWTVERDEDLTGTYAYSDIGDWIAFDDELASQIKVKKAILKLTNILLMVFNKIGEIFPDTRNCWCCRHDGKRY